MRSFLPPIAAAALASMAGSVEAQDIVDVADVAEVADPTDTRPGIAAAVPGATGAKGRSGSLVFVGPSGQLYEPSAPSAWRRAGLGGVAAEVIGALRTPDGTIFVAGGRTPLYRHASRTWHAHPLPNRGRLVLPDPTSAPVLAISRHIYTWQGGSWRRLTSARTRVTAVWSRTPGQGSPTGRVYAATEAGRIAYFERGGWHTIRSSLGPGDPVRWLVGQPGKRLYAITQAGVAMAVGTKSGMILTMPSTLQGFRPEAATVDGRGVLWLVGRRMAPVAAPDGVAANGSEDAQNAEDGATAETTDDDGDTGSTGPTENPPVAAGAAILVRSERHRLVPAGELADLGGARITVLHAASGQNLVLVTQNGRVRLRSSDGSWQNGTVIGQAELEHRGSEAAAPAPTR